MAGPHPDESDEMLRTSSARQPAWAAPASHRQARAGELVAKVAVDGPEPIGKRDHGFTVGVKHHVAVVNVQHVGRFHERVIEIFVRRVQRMVDLEGTGILEQGPVNIDVAPKIPCPSIGRSATGKGKDR
jgi:hypothetical protein